ncbi:hypothetical protein CYMTET_46472 [Cymbomonas tetramitiformis]|uniref:PBP domain-containing protein n=1 Tax=Cymbomonas tetramitiformis TaxID=36881 RepID=A0AAE0BY31_9CHLO|nr:hypothetical protein CYMTET_46472 [Cymbomonas tetramitiformis]
MLLKKVFIIGLLSAAIADAEDTVYSLHGSGTTNPSKLFWKVMDVMEERAKVPMFMTYRAVGSSTGMKEFVGEDNGFVAYNHFGSGDVPMTQERYDSLTGSGASMVHIPFVLGAISVFHSVPNAPAPGLKLTACLLSKIFQRRITTWDHEEILLENPGLEVPAGQNIVVVHRVKGSSSTAGTTEYLKSANSEADAGCQWDQTTGTTSNWTDDTVGQQGSDGVADYIAETPYAIGYLDSGHGVARGLEEIELQNLDKVYLKSVDADLSAAATTAVLPADASLSWADVNLYNQPGASTWPITMMSYFYLRTDVTELGASGTLLKAFVEYVLSTEGQELVKEFGFEPVSSDFLAFNNETLKSVSAASSPIWEFEESDDTRVGEGAGEFVLSGKRKAYAEYERSLMQSDIESLQTSMAAVSSVYELHGSGTTNPSKLFWKVMDVMEERAKVPMFMTYRAVGSSTGMKEFVGEDNGFVAYNHFGVPNAPAPGLKLTACLLSKIFQRRITTWDHEEILLENPGLEVPAGQNIVVVHRVKGSSSTAGTTEYLKSANSEADAGCQWDQTTGTTSNWTDDTVGQQGSDGVADYIAETPYAIGYLDSGHGVARGLEEIELQNLDKVYLKSVDADLSAAATTAVLPADASLSWADVNLYNQPGASTWPITMMSYFYLRTDVTELGASGTLLKAFVEYVLSTEGQELVKEFGFEPVSSDFLAFNNETLKSVSAASSPIWEFEESDDTRVGEGAGEFVLSGKRKAYAEYERSLMQSDIESLQTSMAAVSSVYELHGSGTTNPSKLFWKVMDVMEERAKVPMFMTYRAVGSSTGMKEFVGEDNGFVAYNHFGSGDVPMTQERYDSLTGSGASMVHIPFVLGAISVFHSVPNAPAPGLKLTACLLSKIFQRRITTWDHEEILLENPGLEVPAGQNIVVVHRVKGSSSTAGTTEYLKSANSEADAGCQWDQTTGTTSNWTDDTVGQQGSDGVADYIAETPYAIGYLDSGHGVARGLEEIELQNLDKVYLKSVDADLSAAATTAVLPADASLSWADVNLYNQPGASTWPITMMSYFYLRTDVTELGASGTLLKAFVEYVLSTEGQELVKEFGFEPVSSDFLAFNNETLKSVSAASSPIWEFEESDDTRVGEGAGEFVLSGKRKAYAEYERSLMQSDIESLQTSMAAVSSVYELHGSGTTNPSKLFWKVMDVMEERAKVPMFMTYRAVGSSTGMKEFVGEDNGFVAYNHFGSGDVPMTQERYDSLTGSGASMVHIPFVLGAISVFHSVPNAPAPGLKLTACLLSKIFQRRITTWDHEEILLENPGLEVPAGQNIVVVHRVKGSSSTAGTTEYLKSANSEADAGCQWDQTTGTTSNWTDDTVGQQGSDGVADYIAETPYAIGYLDSGHGVARGLEEIELQNLDKVYLKSVDADLSAAATTAVLPADASLSWADVNLYNQPGASTWPITMMSYFYLRTDVTELGASGTLLKAFVEYVLSTEGQELVKEFGFEPVSSDFLAFNNETLKSVSAASSPIWEFEESDDTRVGEGAGEFVLSGKRKAYAEYERSLMQSDIESLQTSMAAVSSVYELHGSGTTNPSKLFWKVMDVMEERAKVPMFMTYRAVGSSTGMKEFVGEDNGFVAYNHFGSGDVPMTQERYDSLTGSGASMVHIPFVLGAISVFHSVPNAPAPGLKLTACLLSKIFQRRITTWDHEEILLENPGLEVPAGQNIVVVHRVKGSSSTAGTTEYLKSANSEADAGCQWDQTTGTTSNWADDTVGQQGSDGVADYIAETPYAIGYLDSGHGVARGLEEIELQNLDKVYLKSVDADLSAAATTAVLPADASLSWADVNLYNQPGASTWPITMMSYFYLRTDVTELGASGTLLKAFVEYVLSTEGQELVKEFGFEPVSSDFLAFNNETLKSVSAASSPIWEFEESDDTRVGEGAGEFVLSGKRKAYAEYERSLMQSDIESLQTSMAAVSSVYELHGSGTTNPSKLFWKVMDVMEERAKVPMFMTYRAVGSSTGMKEFVGEDNGFVAYNHFGSGDVPMTQERYDSLTGSGASMVHIPFVLGAISVFHSVPNAPAPGLKLTACLLSKIFQRRITTWDHEEILLENPGLEVPAGQNIVVVHRVKGSSSTAGTTEYLKSANSEADAGCQWDQTTGTTSNWADDTVGQQGSDGVADYIAETPYAIGYLDSGHGVARGLEEIELQNLDKVYLKSVDADLSAAATTAVLPADASLSWADVNLYNQPGASTWPITMMSYFYLRTDVTELGASGTLLKAFVEYVLSTEGQELVKEFGFEPVSSDFLAFNNETLKSVSAASSPIWEFEESDDTRVGEGAGEFVLSGKRKAYAEYERSLMQSDIESLQATVATLESRLQAVESALGILPSPPPSPPSLPPSSPSPPSPPPPSSSAATTDGADTSNDDDDGKGGPLGFAALIIAIIAAIGSMVNAYQLNNLAKNMGQSGALGCMAPVQECMDPRGEQKNPHLKLDDQL